MRDDLMVQEQVKSEWQHMVGVICLNQTGRKKVKKILPRFFERFPNAWKLLLSDKDTIAEMVSMVVTATEYSIKMRYRRMYKIKN